MMRGTRKLAERLERALSAVPGWNAGGGTQSSTIAGVAGYANDAETAIAAARVVLRGMASRDPHPVLGDDGWAEESRDEARAAIDWLERWVDWRRARNWQPVKALPVGTTLPAPVAEGDDDADPS